MTKDQNLSHTRAYFDSVTDSRMRWRQKNSYYHRCILRYLQFVVPEDATVLDIGCFSGEQLAALKPGRGVGIDFGDKVIEIARSRFPHLEFHARDVDDVAVDETFDYVVINNTIGYAQDLQTAFASIKKVCRVDTKVVLFYHNNLWRPFLKLAELLGLRMKWSDQHWVARQDIRNLLELNDFEIISQSEQILFPFNIPIVSTLFNRYLVHLPVLKHLALNHVFIAKPRGARRPPEEVTCSVIVPCRNEKGNIEAAVLRTPPMGAHTEIIFVEGHSSDGTLEECRRVKTAYKGQDIKVMVQQGKGKGDAVREGFAAASGDVLMILDADLTTPPEDMPKFFNAIVQGKGEFINGTRLVYKMEDEAMRFLNMIANKTFSIVLTYLLGQYLKDTLCGTKVLWKEDYAKIVANRSYFGDFDPFGDFDLLFGAAKLNLKIVEIPVQYKARTYGSTQISRFRHGWLLIKMTFFAMRKIKFID
jgi:SAM-dependent methyltransferase